MEYIIHIVQKDLTGKIECSHNIEITVWCSGMENALHGMATNNISLLVYWTKSVYRCLEDFICYRCLEDCIEVEEYQIMEVMNDGK